jgi:hypothetical protein
VLSGISLNDLRGLAFGPDGGLYVESVMGQSIIPVNTDTRTKQYEELFLHPLEKRVLLP